MTVAIIVLTICIILAFYFFCVVREIQRWGSITSAKLDHIIQLLETKHDPNQ